MVPPAATAKSLGVTPVDVMVTVTLDGAGVPPPPPPPPPVTGGVVGVVGVVGLLEPPHAREPMIRTTVETSVRADVRRHDTWDQGNQSLINISTTDRTWERALAG